MSTVNPLIPLSGNSGFDVSNFLKVATEAQTLKQNQIAMRNQNALQQMLANPQSYDDKGVMTPSAMRLVTAADPKVGIELKNQSIAEQLKQAQDKAYQDDHTKIVFDTGAKISGVARNAYDETLKTGGSEQMARDAAIKARNDAAKESGGILGDDKVNMILSSPYDPDASKAYASLDKDWVAGRREEKQETHQEKSDLVAQQRADTAEKAEADRNKAMIAALTFREKGGADPKKEAFAAFVDKWRAEHKGQDPSPEEMTKFIQSESGMGAGALSDRAKALQSEMMIQAVPLPTGIRSAQFLTGALNNVVDQHPDMSPQEIASQIKSGALEFKARAAETQQVAKREGNIAASATALTEPGGLYDQLDAAATKINLGDAKVASDVKLGVQKHLYANPDIQRYVTVLEDTRADLTNVLARTGQATETVRAQAMHMFPENMSLAELRTAIDASKRVTAAVMSGNEKVMEALKGGKSVMEAAGVADINKENEARGAKGKPKSAVPADIQAILDKHAKPPP